MGILENIEKEATLNANLRMRNTKRPFTLTPAVITFLATPFVIGKIIFVPVFGQLLALMNLFILIGYLRARRSWLVTLSVLGAFVLCCVMLILLSGNFPRRMDIFVGTVMVLCTAVSMTLSIILGCAWYSLRADAFNTQAFSQPNSDNATLTQSRAS